jgi:hypothetical protein
MNKQKRHILQLQANMCTRLTRQVKPEDREDRKEIQARYHPFKINLMGAAHLVSLMSPPKRARLGRAFVLEATDRHRDGLVLWGNLYTLKALMLAAVNRDWFVQHTANKNVPGQLATSLAFFHR